MCCEEREKNVKRKVWSADKEKLMKSSKTSRVVSEEIIHTPYTASELHAAPFMAVILSN
jgi:hypothetical protein